MPAAFLSTAILVPVFITTGYWFFLQGRQTVAWKILKLLHTAYLLVLGITLIALSASTANHSNFEYWVQWFLTNMLVWLYCVTAMPCMAGFLWGHWRSTVKV